MYHPDGYMHSSHSTSTSGQVPPMQYHPPNVGIPPYGYDFSMFHEKPIDGKLNFKHSQIVHVKYDDWKNVFNLHTRSFVRFVENAR